MLKLLGAFVLMAGCIGFGRCLCAEMEERIRQLRLLERVFALLGSEVEYNRATIPEGLRRAGGRTGEELGQKLQTIADRTCVEQGNDLEQVWREELDGWLKETVLRDPEKKLVYGFPGYIGFSDGQMQLREIQRMEEELKKAEDRAVEELSEKRKMILSLSITGGLLVMILLL